MTPSERAGFIEAQLRMFEKSGSSSGIRKAVEFIAAQIEEAQREAVEWKVKEMLSDAYMLANFCKGRDEGFAAAREKAAEIATDYPIIAGVSWATPHVREIISDRIRAMEPRE